MLSSPTNGRAKAPSRSSRANPFRLRRPKKSKTNPKDSYLAVFETNGPGTRPRTGECGSCHGQIRHDESRAAPDCESGSDKSMVVEKDKRETGSAPGLP